MSVEKGAYLIAERLPRPGRRLRLGMVGGGGGGFFATVHRAAAGLDNRYKLVAGALSSRPNTAKEAAAEWLIAPERAYASYAHMAEAEAAREDGIDVVSVVTPNHTHHAIARAFLDRGIDVICEKPMTTTLADATDLVRRVGESGLVFGVVYTFSGYPMVRQARAMVAAGELGAIRVVQVELLQDWLATPIEATGDRHAKWRTDPALAGPGGALGDIGVHAYHLASFVTGLEPVALSALTHTFVPGRKLDDDAHVLLRYAGGARGALWLSQIATGHEATFRLRVYGERAGIEWSLAEANRLTFAPLGGPPRSLGRGNADLRPDAQRASRLPSGLPEGQFEALATLYSEWGVAIEARREGRATPEVVAAAPGVEEGARGVHFIEAAVESSAHDGAWVDAPP